MIQAKPAATIADLYRVEAKAELANGEIVITSPASARHGRVSGWIYRSLLQYEESTGRGYAFPDNVGFIVDLPRRQSFSPDAAAAGTEVMWDVDMIRDKVVRVYRAAAPNQPTGYGVGDTAEAEPAVPGWKMEVAELPK